MRSVLIGATRCGVQCDNTVLLETQGTCGSVHECSADTATGDTSAQMNMSQRMRVLLVQGEIPLPPGLPQNPTRHVTQTAQKQERQRPERVGLAWTQSKGFRCVTWGGVIAPLASQGTKQDQPKNREPGNRATGSREQRQGHKRKKADETTTQLPGSPPKKNEDSHKHKNLKSQRTEGSRRAGGSEGVSQRGGPTSR